MPQSNKSCGDYLVETEVLTLEPGVVEAANLKTFSLCRQGDFECSLALEKSYQVLPMSMFLQGV